MPTNGKTAGPGGKIERLTLILSYVASDCVYQVADRRLTEFGNPNNAIDDETNKIVVVDGRLAFGYTGRSKIHADRTDDWLASTAAAVMGKYPDMANVTEHIRAEATKAFRAIASPSRFKFHAFQAVGWLKLNGEDFVSPAVITIHNGLDETTGRWLKVPLEEFRRHLDFPEVRRRHCRLSVVGASIHPGEWNAVCRFMRTLARRPYLQGATVLRALLISMDYLTRSHRTIGGGMMTIRIPKTSVERLMSTGDFMALVGAPNSTVSTFQCFSSAGVPQNIGPVFVGSGGTIVKNSKVTGLEPHH